MKLKKLINLKGIVSAFMVCVLVFGSYASVFGASWDEEGANLLAQFKTLVGERQAGWIVEDTDLALLNELLGDDIFNCIMNLDILLFMEEFLPEDMMEVFFSLEHLERYWFILDLIFEILIDNIDDFPQLYNVNIFGTTLWNFEDLDWDWDYDFDWDEWDFDALDELPELHRQEVYDTTHAVFDDFLNYADFDMFEVLRQTGISFDHFVDLLIIVLTVEMAASGPVHTWGDYWLQFYLEDLISSFSIQTMQDLVMGLRSAWLSNDLFFDMLDIFGEDFFDALYDSPYYVEIVEQYGMDLVNILDFLFYDAIEILYIYDEWTEGLYTLDKMLGGLIRDNLDVLLEFHEHNYFIKVLDSLVLPIEVLWDAEIIRLDNEAAEERFSYNLDSPKYFEILIDPEENARLNLFFENTGESYTIFIIQNWIDESTAENHIIEVAPGRRAVLQLFPEQMTDGIVFVVLANTDNEEVSGEFAFRKTHLPLGQEVVSN